MPEDRESKRGKGDGKSKVHKAGLRDDVGKDANACGLRQHAWHFRCDVELEQRPCDAKSKNQVGCEMVPRYARRYRPSATMSSADLTDVSVIPRPTVGIHFCQKRQRVG